MLMRKVWGMGAILAASLLSAGAAHAQDAYECLIDTRAPDLHEAALARFGYGFDGYDSLCAALAETGMGVVFYGAAGQVSDRSYGLVTLAVFDGASGVEGNAVITATSLDEALTDEGRDYALIRAINEAMRLLSTNPQHYIASAAEELSRQQALFSEQ